MMKFGKTRSHDHNQVIFFRWRGDKGVMHQILTNRASRVSVNETRLALLHCDVPVSSYDHISLYSTIKGPDCQKGVCNNSSGHPSAADPVYELNLYAL